MENRIKKILFYTSIPRSFRTTLIGHLYEIAQLYPVVLLSEKLDSETEAALNNKELFPRLQAIVPAFQYTRWHTNFFTKNRELYNIAKKSIERYKPDIVITANDTFPFEMYLMRCAKRKGALTILLQGGIHAADIEQEKIWLRLMSVYSETSPFFPVWYTVLIGKIRKYIGHFLYYWIAPLLVGEAPFRGKSSFVLWRKLQSLRDADYQVAFSEREYDMYVQGGAKKEELYILSHPLARKGKTIFEKIYMPSLQKEKKGTPIATFLFPVEEIGFRKADLSLISKEEMQKSRKEIVQLMSKILGGWRIIIKPHPAVRDGKEISKILEPISDQIIVVDPSDPVDSYIEMSEVIVGIPPPSTALFTASLQCPAKPILSLDLWHELMGDTFKDFKGIEYVDTEKQLVSVLRSIKDHTYQKKREEKPEQKGFASAVELIEHLVYEKRK